MLRSGGQRLDRGVARLLRGRGLFARLGLLARIALTPKDMPAADALRAIAVALGEGVRLLGCAFHLPSLVPGRTPEVRDAADLARFQCRWERIFTDCARRWVPAASLDAVVFAAGLPAAGGGR